MPSSAFLVSSLLECKFDIALALIDNLVAYQEGQGEAKIPANPDLVAFMGSDGGFLSVVAAPGNADFAALKGKTLSVDAMTTGAAFVLREIMARNAIAETDVTSVRAGGTANRYRDLLAGKQQATLLRSPFDLLAKDREAALTGFIRAYRAAVDWLYDRANRDIVEALLIANSRDMTPALARPSYDLLLADKGGITRDLSIDPAGIRMVLELRGKYGVPRKALTEPAKYIDLSYLEKAAGKR